jgi:N-acetyl-gamma-glutamyl-phosphate reductase
MPPRIFIDGQAGTTALRIRDWLAGRDDLEVIVVPEALRCEMRRSRCFAFRMTPREKPRLGWRTSR